MLWVLAVGATAGIAGGVRGQESGRPPEAAMSPREEKALELIVTATTTEDPEARKREIRKLADYPYASVAQALVQMLSDELLPDVVAEVEWALVTLEELAIPPLAAAVRAGEIPEDSALLVLTRLARRESSRMAALLAAEDPAIARLAALALATCDRREATELLAASLEEVSGAAYQAGLRAICHTASKHCQETLTAALRSHDPGVLVEAFGLMRSREMEELAPSCVSLLHHADPLVVRAALEALSTLGAKGSEKDLQILFDEGDLDVKEQVLQVMGATATEASSSFLRTCVQRYSRKTRLGTEALRLYRATAGRRLVTGSGPRTVPAEAAVNRDLQGRLLLILFNEDGNRVAGAGEMAVRCPGAARGKWAAVKARDFGAEGALPVPSRCPGDGSPQVFWRTPKGAVLEAASEE
jgi:HEAT repeat protein